MLVVKLMLLPFGRSQGSKEIGRLEISNEGGPENACRYLASQYGEGVDGKTLNSRNFTRVTHDRAKGAWALVERCLGALTETCAEPSALLERERVLAAAHRSAIDAAEDREEIERLTNSAPTRPLAPSDAGEGDEAMTAALTTAADRLDATQCIDCDPSDPNGSYCGKCERAYAAAMAMRSTVSRLATLRERAETMRAWATDYRDQRDSALARAAAAEETIARAHAMIGRDSHGPAGDARCLLSTLADVLEASKSNSADAAAAEDRAAAAERERDEARAEVDFHRTDSCQMQASRDAAIREVERWRHGTTIEGDFVCPNALAEANLRDELTAAEKRAAEAEARLKFLVVASAAFVPKDGATIVEHAATGLDVIIADRDEWKRRALARPASVEAAVGECKVCHGLDPACGAVCGLRSVNDVRSMCISLASFIAAIDESSEDVAEYLRQRLGPLLARSDAATFDAVLRDTNGLVKPHPLSAAALRSRPQPAATESGETGGGK